MRRAAKVDSNQADIVGKLRKIPGISVAVTSAIGNGFPDIVVGFRGRSHLIEIKDGAKTASRRKLTPDEIKFKDKWTGCYFVGNSFDEIIDYLFNQQQGAK